MGKKCVVGALKGKKYEQAAPAQYSMLKRCFIPLFRNSTQSHLLFRSEQATGRFRAYTGSILPSHVCLYQKRISPWRAVSDRYERNSSRETPTKESSLSKTYSLAAGAIRTAC